MGLDASVMCTCFAEGRATPPPFPDLVHLDKDGYISLNLPYAGHEAEHDLFEDWRQGCCDHPDMDYAAEHISNWPGFTLFWQALTHAGWEHFPTLRAELPHANGGLTPAAAAARALGELVYFRAQADLGTSFFLVNSETGRVIHERIEAYGGRFCMQGPDLEFGLDSGGFFIVDSGSPRELFRAMRVEQRLLEPELIRSQRAGKVEYRDLEDGRRVVCNGAVSEVVPWPDGRWSDDRGRVCFHYPARMHVEERSIQATDFSFLLEPLTRIFEAAVVTGNPVCWA